MKRLIPATLLLLAPALTGFGAAAAQDVMPEPPRRPAELSPAPPTDTPGTPPAAAAPAIAAPPPVDAACAALDADEGIDAAAAAAVPGENGCGMAAPVSLRRVKVGDGRWVTFDAPPVVNCAMAGALAGWVRDLAAHATTKGVAAIAMGSGYECRGRNRIVGAKLSEHATGNAADVRGLRMADAAGLPGGDPVVPEDEGYRALTCARFTTVLGHGADRYHGDHTHLDLAARRSGYRLCQFAPAAVPQRNVNDKATP